MLMETGIFHINNNQIDVKLKILCRLMCVKIDFYEMYVRNHVKTNSYKNYYMLTRHL